MNTTAEVVDNDFDTHNDDEVKMPEDTQEDPFGKADISPQKIPSNMNTGGQEM